MHSDARQIIDNLCVCQEGLQQYDQAEVWRRKWLAAVKENGRTESEAYAEDLMSLGSNLLAQNKHAEAEAVLRECLGILPKTLSGPKQSHYLRSHLWLTSHTQLLLGAALLGQRQFADAEPLLLQGYEGMRKAAQDKSQQHHSVETNNELNDAIKNLAQLYEDWGKPLQATKWRNELQARPAK